MSNIHNIGAAEIEQAKRDERYASLFGPRPIGSDLIVDGRAIPKVTIYEDADGQAVLVLDGRMAFGFPKELAAHAASLAANAMAIGAGYSHAGADESSKAFAMPCGPIGENV